MAFFSSVRKNVQWWILFFVVFYSVVAWITPNPEFLLILRTAQVVISAVTLWAYRYAFATVLRNTGEMRGEDIATLGVGLVWSAEFSDGVWYLYWMLADEPLWMLNSPITGSSVFLLTFGGIFLLSAPGSRKGQLPISARWTLVLSIVLSIVVWSAWLNMHDVFKSSSIHLRRYFSEIPEGAPPIYLQELRSWQIREYQRREKENRNE